MEKRLGVIGLSEGNGHPYSWSAIFNGYERDTMAKCPFAVIPEYLALRKPEDFGIDGYRVTHIWCQDRSISEAVAAASRIKTIVADPRDMIGEVDGVLLARDDAATHVPLAMPFIDAGVPILIDKPLADSFEDLKTFRNLYRSGARIMSCSSCRYDSGLQAIRSDRSIGELVTMTGMSFKYWRTYGIHLVEGMFAATGKRVESVQNIGREGDENLTLIYEDGVTAVLRVQKRLHPGVTFAFHGTAGTKVPESDGAFSMFKATLTDFVTMLRTDVQPFDWNETIHLCAVIVAGVHSRERGGIPVLVSEVEQALA